MEFQLCDAASDLEERLTGIYRAADGFLAAHTRYEIAYIIHDADGRSLGTELSRLDSLAQFRERIDDFRRVHCPPESRKAKGYFAICTIERDESLKMHARLGFDMPAHKGYIEQITPGEEYESLARDLGERLMEYLGRN